VTGILVYLFASEAKACWRASSRLHQTYVRVGKWLSHCVLSAGIESSNLSADTTIKEPMKVQEREQARRLRAEGQAVTHIAATLGVSGYSVARWTHDIALTGEQVRAIRGRDTEAAGRAIRARATQKRQQWQAEGRQRARRRSKLYAMGCMLYWGEGCKTRNTLNFINSDPKMLLLFVRFLREELKVADADMCVTIHCHTGNGIAVSAIEDYWLRLLGLSRVGLRTTQVDRVATVSKRLRTHTLPYGVCRVAVHSTQLAQQVFGAIQYYGNFRRDDW
jgi:hypothetical protein